MLYTFLIRGCEQGPELKMLEGVLTVQPAQLIMTVYRFSQRIYRPLVANVPVRRRGGDTLCDMVMRASSSSMVNLGMSHVTIEKNLPLMSFHFSFCSYVPFPWLKLELFITGCWSPPFPLSALKAGRNHHLLFAICFSIPSYVHQQLHSLDCQKFGHHNSLEFFLPIMGPLLVQGLIFERGPTIFKMV